ncbi:MAG: cobalamin-dependent protein [Candidatus Eremiobacteraeota bacterium]|nr:cobalamin-dependent protein [Candidatus Eremiobacteraeota bacterium]MCW5869269.1 cobalamin-dependent protein [Candidatus Eremiobacteraeota bacterium]
MIDILFLSPPRRHDGSNYLFNNATLQLGSFLHQNGLDVRIEPLIGPAWRDQLERALSFWKPRWAAISCKWWDTVYGATEVARYIRENHPGVKLVSGGQTATSFAEDLVAQDYFHAVITGDAEVPLTHLVKGEPDCNVVLKANGVVSRLPQKYVQPRTGGDKLQLISDLTEIAPTELLYQAGFTAPFVWTGKGCRSTCSYCSGSAFGHKKLFGRTGFQYRPVEDVISDMQALSPWTRNAVMFDFDPVTDPGREDYYLEIARQLPPKRYHAAFYCWTLPTKEFIAQVSELFASAIISLDAQTYSEPLRLRLATKKQIKPYASDQELLGILDYLRNFPNIHGIVYGILGLQGETPYDVERGESLMAYIQDAYHDVLQPNGVHTTPLSVEPDSLMDRNPEKYGMTRLRHGLDDYLAFTKMQFYSSGQFTWSNQYSEEDPHPYGVHQSHEDPARVFHDFKRIQGRINDKSQRWDAEKAVRSLRLEEGRLILNLQTRSIFQDDWRLILWAAAEALSRNLPEVVINTQQAHVRVPPAQIFPFDDQFGWAESQWAQIRQARDSGKLNIRYDLGSTTDLGFLVQ